MSGKKKSPDKSPQKSPRPARSAPVDSSAGTLPFSTATSDAQVFASALTDVMTRSSAGASSPSPLGGGPGGDAIHGGFASSGVPASSVAGGTALPSSAPELTSLRDFFAEFDSRQSEFLSLTESELKKQGRAERFALNKVEEYLTFALSSETYGLPIARVREIIKPQTLTFVPRQAPHIAGILSLRGAIVPVVALGKKLGLGESSATRQTRIVVLEDQEELVGFFVDEVYHVVRLPAHAVEPSPQWKGSAYQDIIRGVGRADQQMIILLEFDLLLGHLRAA